MIKLLITGVWICVLSLGSVYVSMQMSANKASEKPPAPFFGGLDYVRGDLTSVPVISGGIVHGYFLVRLVYTVDPSELSAMSVPAKDLVTDELYTLLVGNRVIDFPKMDNFDLAAFRKQVKDALNKRVGKELFHDVMVDQIDYLTKEDIRASRVRGNYSSNDLKPVPDKGLVKPTAGG
ncbi:MAG: hypothetical protein ACTHJ3_07190 [Pararhizobium sp.]